MRQADEALFTAFALGALSVILDRGELEFDVWLAMGSGWNVNLFSNSESVMATAYPVKNGLMDTSHAHHIYTEYLQ